MQIVVRQNSVGQALRALKKKLQREGVYREMKLRRHYEKPSEKRAREHAAAVSRARKADRNELRGMANAWARELTRSHWRCSAHFPVSEVRSHRSSRVAGKVTSVDRQFVRDSCRSIIERISNAHQTHSLARPAAFLGRHVVSRELMSTGPWVGSRHHLDPRHTDAAISDSPSADSQPAMASA